MSTQHDGIKMNSQFNSYMGFSFLDLTQRKETEGKNENPHQISICCIKWPKCDGITLCLETEEGAVFLSNYAHQNASDSREAV